MRYNFLVLLNFISTSVNCLSQLEHYKEIIEKRINDSRTYQAPKDASQYKPENENNCSNFDGEYDFIIIGGGSTGAVIANRLSEITDWKILLLEAGKFPDEVTDIPAMAAYNMNSDFNWNFESVEQTTACLGTLNKKCAYPRGCGIGGSSLLNVQVYNRGDPKDFDQWENLGNPGWSYNSVLPYFKKSEHLVKNEPNAPVNNDYHGFQGPLNIEFHTPQNQHLQNFYSANQKFGYNLTDYNGPHRTGYSPVQLTRKYGVRGHTGNAFIKPILNRVNLKIVTESFVTKILIDSKKVAYGVKFVNQKSCFLVNATKEVIISAGVFGSAQILMLSGIGRKNHLESVKIDLVEDLGVGEVLRDHVAYFGLVFNWNLTAVKPNLLKQIQEYFHGNGLLTSYTNTEGIGFYQSNLETEFDYPDIELLFIPEFPFEPELQSKMYNPETYGAIWGKTKPENSFAINVIVLNTHSTGTVRLKSNDPYEFLEIDSKFLSDDKDISIMLEGIELALKLVQTDSFRKFDSKLVDEQLPACSNTEFLSKSYWICAMKLLTGNLFHPMSTCQMGPDPKNGAVVDANLKVHGVKNLRVADASVFPLIIRNHPNAACMMVGEKLSDLLKTQYDRM